MKGQEPLFLFFAVVKCLICCAAVFVKPFPFPLLVTEGVIGVSVFHSYLLCQMSFLLKGNYTIKTFSIISAIYSRAF